MASLFDVIGVLGVIIILTMYVLLQTERINSTTISYSAWNLVGSLSILGSLLFSEFNLPAFLIEIFWTVISLYGVVKAIRKRTMENAARA